MIQNTPTLHTTRIRSTSRSTTDLVVLLVLLSDVAFNWLYVQVLQRPLEALFSASFETLPPLAVLSLLKLGFIVVGVMYWIGRVRPQQIGVTREHLQSGIIGVCLVWCLMHAIEMGAYFLSGTPLLASLSWDVNNPIFSIAAFLAFLVTKALFDEIIYRSLLIPHALQRIQKLIALPYPLLLVVAVLLSQTLYVLIQISLFPIHNEMSFMASLTAIITVSILSTIMYVRTENVFLSAGVHAMWFFPAMMIPPITAYYPILFGCGIFIALVWPRLDPGRKVKGIRRR